MNINLSDFYLGLWGFSAKYLGGKTLVRKDPELLIIKEKNVFGKTIYYSKTEVCKTGVNNNKLDILLNSSIHI